jgi:hypothetical protein
VIDINAILIVAIKIFMTNQGLKETLEEVIKVFQVKLEEVSMVR